MKWLADENIPGAVAHGLRSIDLVRVQDVPEIVGAPDGRIVEWETREGRVLITRDCATIPAAVREQIERQGHCCPVVYMPFDLAVGSVIEGILYLDACSTPTDWVTGTIWLPLR